ncbi:hypothetical protein DES53_108241 [Roseimicrobium gellanilyticum]|uniref:Uncharacterized protein n=1 Tax=Roseimicrobium gellanilyticum TaxID=748857 RepID=A0A366HFT3_9BACT|nr:hypothetical protein [Roseimicrobium gellanilyticum]RBP40534.1 hypothetical protein DES53_108241 [Roseimicrobium gellanilyticum]
MPQSQNLRFIATSSEDLEFEHPPGASLMRGLIARLEAAGWRPGDMENWRDAGWFAECNRGEACLEVTLASIEEPSLWMLQISPTHRPGLIGRLFGGKPSAAPADIYELALAVHHALSTLGCLDDPRWRWDGFPDVDNSTAVPRAA